MKGGGERKTISRRQGTVEPEHVVSVLPDVVTFDIGGAGILAGREVEPGPGFERNEALGGNYWDTAHKGTGLDDETIVGVIQQDG